MDTIVFLDKVCLSVSFRNVMNFLCFLRLITVLDPLFSFLAQDDYGTSVLFEFFYSLVNH